MENEVKEVLEEGVVDELDNVNQKSSKVAIFGAVAAVTGLLFVFRKKISARVEKRMVKKLTKKGYSVYKSESTCFPDELELPETID